MALSVELMVGHWVQGWGGEVEDPAAQGFAQMDCEYSLHGPLSERMISMTGKMVLERDMVSSLVEERNEAFEVPSSR